MARKVMKRRGHLTGFIFWLCVLLIAAPIGLMGWILYSSQKDSGAPVLGNRYEGDLDPAITKNQLEEIEQSIAAMEGVEKSFVRMPTATLRVYLDIADDAGADTAYAKASEAYGVVTSILDPAVYFTQSEGKKMYDMEIHVYNLDEDREADNFVYVIETKNSKMEGPKAQLVSEPLDAELAQELRDAVARREEAARQAEAEAQAAQEAQPEGEVPPEGEAPAEGEEPAEGEQPAEGAEG